MGIDKFNDACRASVHEVRRRVEGLRHPPGALGGLRQRLQDAQRRVHGVGPLGLQAAATRRASPTTATACCPYCWKDETPLSNHELRMDDDVYKMPPGPRRSLSRSPSRQGSPSCPRHSQACEALAWTTTPWTLPTNLALAGRVRTSPTRSCPPDPNGVKAASAEAPVPGSFLLAAGAGWRRTPRTWAYDDAAAAAAAVVPRTPAPSSPGLSYEPLWNDFADADEVRHAERLALPGRRLRHHHATARASSTRRRRLR